MSSKSRKSILFCYAHPDDEIGDVALANRYMREEGAHTTLICTTNGDVGTVDAEHLRGYASISELRLAEFSCATQAAGFDEVVTFGYRDSGMMGSADNENPNCSWQIPLETLTQQVAEVMRRVRPQVVITFNTFGAYGHPDHIKINQATVAAFQQLQAEPEHPQKLYYASGPDRLLRIGIMVMRLRGKDPRKGGRNHDMDYVAAVEATTPVTTKVRVTKYLDPMWKALNCYASQIQIPPAVRRFRRLLGPMVQGTTSLSRVYPEWRPGERIERDIFEGVTF
jgi:LmbE family N-acetylglucosaminyl deacetylase